MEGVHGALRSSCYIACYGYWIRSERNAVDYYDTLQNFTRSGCSNAILRVTPLWVARYGMVSALASHPTNRCPFGPHVVLLATCYDNSMPDMTWPLPRHCRCPEIVLVQKSTLKYVDFVVVFAASRICCCRFAMVKPSCLTRLSGYGARFPSIDAKWTPFLPWNQPINSSQWRF